MEGNDRGRLERSVRIMSDLLMYVSAALLLVMLFLGIADVTGRYLFNRPIIGTAEIFEVLMPGMVLLSLAYTQRVKAHVTVDLFISKISPRPRAIIDFAITLWAILLFGIIVWQGILMVFSYHESGRVLTNIGVPMFLPRLLVPLGALAICFVFFVDLLHLMREIRKNG